MYTHYRVYDRTKMRFNDDDDDMTAMDVVVLCCVNISASFPPCATRMFVYMRLKPRAFRNGCLWSPVLGHMHTDGHKRVINIGIDIYNEADFWRKWNEMYVLKRPLFDSNIINNLFSLNKIFSLYTRPPVFMQPTHTHCDSKNSVYIIMCICNMYMVYVYLYTYHIMIAYNNNN